MHTQFYATVIILQIMDYLTTKLAFWRSGAVELNPLVGFGIQPSDGSLLLAKFLVALVLCIAAYRKPRISWLLWTACGAYGLIVINNLCVAGRVY